MSTLPNSSIKGNSLQEANPLPFAEARLSRRTLSQQRQFTESNLSRLEAESISNALPEGFPNRDKNITLQVLRLEAPIFTSVFVTTLLNIASGSIWGVLARKGLIALTSYPGLYLGGLVWANFVACYVMGMAMESEVIWYKLLADEELKALFSTKSAIPFYVGITTGFCGSCSSFSSLILEMFNKAANLPPSYALYPNAAYGILGALEVLLTHLSLSLAGYRAGKHVIRYIERSKFSILTRTYYLLELLSSAFGASGYIVVIVLIATKSASEWRTWTLSCLFAPWGSLLRYTLSRKLNSIKKDFPVGTYAANFSGSILLAIFNLLIRGKKSKGLFIPIVNNIHGCDVLVGLDDGFCGCLTTVSTFMVELCTLTMSPSYIYGSFSIITSFVGMLLILGLYNWIIGLTNAVC